MTQDMKEIVVISGKGGTGKTSLVASFAAQVGSVVTADCDVDAADLHLLLKPQIEQSNTFSGGKVASVQPDLCNGCGTCARLCRYEAVSRAEQAPDTENVRYAVDKIACEGCGVCAYFCPTGAISFDDEENGEWYVSSTRFGPMAHARLLPGAENSGKLVTIVRSEAKRIAGARDIGLVLIDGSPGIGCPVIASVSGADLAVVVTEPTMSGLHDLERVVQLARHFGVEAAVVINKHDINEEMARGIGEYAKREGIRALGGIRYDEAVTRAQIEGRTVVEFTDGPIAEDIRRIWKSVEELIE